MEYADKPYEVATAVDVLADENAYILMLEDLDHLTRRVFCSFGVLALQFNEAVAYNISKETWKRWDHFVAIASHDGCGAEFQRTPYRLVPV